MEENPYKAPREFTPLPLPAELRTLRVRLAVLKPTLAAASCLVTFLTMVAVCDREMTVAVGAAWFTCLWFVIAVSCAKVARGLRVADRALPDVPAQR